MRGLGNFLFNQNLFQNRPKWYGYFLGSFPKLRKLLLKFLNPNHSTTNCGNSERKIKWNRNFRQEIVVNLHVPGEVILYLEVLENAVQFGIESFRKFQPEVFFEWKTTLLAENFCCEHTYLEENFVIYKQLLKYSCYYY